MKKILCSVLSIMLLIGIILYVPVSATTVFDAHGDYTCNATSSFVFVAPSEGWYVLSSYDNEDPFLCVEYKDGSYDKFDNEKDDCEFTAFVHLSKGEKIKCKLGTNAKDKKINFVIEPVGKAGSNKDYTVRRRYVTFTAGHDDYYQLHSFNSSDPYLELYMPDGSYKTFDDDREYDFFSEFYLEKGDSIFAFIDDYDGNKVNFRISCDCGGYHGQHFKVGNTYKNIADGTEFTFTAPSEGRYVFKSTGGKDPCFSYIRKNMFFFEFDDEDYKNKKLGFNTSVYLLENEKIHCRVSDAKGVDVNFSITYNGVCKHKSKQWSVYKPATKIENGIKTLVCKDCSFIFKYTNIPQLAPDTPVTSAINSVGGVTVSWNKIEGAVKYVVYRKVASSGELVALKTTTSTLFVDKNVKNNTTYAYTVRAFNSAGGYSIFDSAKATKIKYVATPKLKNIKNTTTGIYLEWSKVSDATGYRVYRKTGKSGYWTYLGTTLKLKYLDNATKDKSGKNYTYTVRAVNGVCSGFDTQGLSVQRLCDPVLKSAVSSKNGIVVKWGEVSGASGYVIYRKNGKGSWTNIGTVKGNSKVSYLDKTAKKGVTYTYTVKAAGSGYMSSCSSTISCKDKY